MKKIIYSDYTKFIAVVLFILSITLGALSVTGGVARYCDEKERIYGFESSFTESKYLSSFLDAPEIAIFNAYHDFYSTDVEDKNVVGERSLILNGETIEQRIEKNLNDLYCADKVNYYVKWNDTVFTNCKATSVQEVMDAQFYRLTTRDDDGNGKRISSQNRYYSYPLLDELSYYDKTTSVVICTSIKEAFATECQLIWDRESEIVNETFMAVVVYAVLSLLMLISLLCVCGKAKNGEHKSMWLDNICPEVHLAVTCGVGIGAVVICAIVLDEYYVGRFPLNMLNWVVGAASALASMVVITSLLSIIRNIKCKRFIDSSVTVRVIRQCWRIFAKVIVSIRNAFLGYRNLVLRTLSKKTGIILITMFLIYTALIGFCGIVMPETPFFLMLAIAVFGFASFVVAYRAKELDEIKKGVSEVRNGNVAYKIPELKCEDMKTLAVNINDIAKGLDESVSAKVKAERLKTELITNVSHDLKTPITSIINYTELLSKIEELPEEAKDYVSVISKKSERLNNLTQDLFDISKVQSGNEDIVLEKLDVALLINQSLGEHDSEIKKSELPFCVDAPKELYISADGRKMSRVIGNLINNILKYSMKNTRVFITAFEKEGEITMEFKNIASYHMNFSADEIVGRFVRGDESRTAEGNGLGLAIAKSYTEICNGKFEVVTDGDMFKATLKFKKYK